MDPRSDLSHLSDHEVVALALLGHVLDSSDPEKTGPLKDDGAAGESAP